MLSAKVTAILLITAIFNPLCCCLNLFANDFTSTPAPVAAHACCNELDSGDTAKKSDHAKSDCPHQSEKQSKINEVADSHTSFAKSQVALVSLLYCLDLQAPQATPTASLALSYDDAPLLPRSPFTETYCVYIL